MSLMVLMYSILMALGHVVLLLLEVILPATYVIFRMMQFVLYRSYHFNNIRLKKAKKTLWIVQCILIILIMYIYMSIYVSVFRLVYKIIIWVVFAIRSTVLRQTPSLPMQCDLTDIISYSITRLIKLFFKYKSKSYTIEFCGC